MAVIDDLICQTRPKFDKLDKTITTLKVDKDSLSATLNDLISQTWPKIAKLEETVVALQADKVSDRKSVV